MESYVPLQVTEADTLAFNQWFIAQVIVKDACDKDAMSDVHVQQNQAVACIIEQRGCIDKVSIQKHCPRAARDIPQGAFVGFYRLDGLILSSGLPYTRVELPLAGRGCTFPINDTGARLVSQDGNVSGQGRLGLPQIPQRR